MFSDVEYIITNAASSPHCGGYPVAQSVQLLRATDMTESIVISNSVVNPKNCTVSLTRCESGGRDEPARQEIKIELLVKMGPHRALPASHIGTKWIGAT